MWTRPAALLAAWGLFVSLVGCAYDDPLETDSLPPSALSLDAVDTLGAVDMTGAADAAEADAEVGFDMVCPNTCMWEGPVILTVESVARDAGAVWVTATLERRPCCAEPSRSSRTWRIDAVTADSQVVASVPDGVRQEALPLSTQSNLVLELGAGGVTLELTREAADSLWSDVLPVARWRDPRSGAGATVQVEVRAAATGEVVAPRVRH